MADGEREEAVAVVGMACRVPGAETLDDLWRLLLAGGDAIGPVPADRTALAAAVGDAEDGARYGGFLPELESWDPEFFGVTPAEAARLDPQQALALEVAWHALEDAGLVPAELADTRTGVFFGQATHDHALRAAAEGDEIGATTNSGLSQAITANRLSYLWDLRGPSLVVDTACSSSLVAAHLALAALRSGECDLAIVGGVNALLSPVPQLGAARSASLAPDGRCRTLDAAASGYVRAEGAGAVVLRRLADARAAGQRAHAVLAATGVNQDGRTNGLTAPSGRAQTALVRDVLERAGAKPERLGHVELHGTATTLGDSIEARALAAALPGRSAPLTVGSLKPNLGHLEGAAGILGLIKTALVLSRETIPPLAHFERPSPLVNLARLGLTVPTSPQPLPDDAEFASVSAFGFGGTNAHAVLARAPEPTAEPARWRGPVLLPLSARDGESLTEVAAAWGDRLRAEKDWSAVAADAHAAATLRTHHRLRVGVAGADRAALLRGLSAVAAGERAPRDAGRARADRGRLAIAFAGDADYWSTLADQLAAHDEHFGAHLTGATGSDAAERARSALLATLAELGVEAAVEPAGSAPGPAELERLADRGVSHLLLLGPAPTADHADGPVTVVSAPGERPTTVAAIAGALYEHGLAPRPAVTAAHFARAGDVPRHPFRRRRHAPPAGPERQGAAALRELSILPGTHVAELTDLAAGHGPGDPGTLVHDPVALARWAAEELGQPAGRVADLTIHPGAPAPRQLVATLTPDGLNVRLMGRRHQRWLPAASCLLTAGNGAHAAPEPALRARLLALPPGEPRHAVLRERLTELLGALLPGGAPTERQRSATFAELGLPSLLGVELRNRLQREWGAPLSMAVVWGHPTIDRLSAALADGLDGEAAGGGVPSPGAGAPTGAGD
ncbi:beta-ketoacyl synthase N-terminal-like domain-containing protein, partial [Streptomyces triticirhizae]